jgi:hypothetical protein
VGRATGYPLGYQKRLDSPGTEAFTTNVIQTQSIEAEAGPEGVSMGECSDDPERIVIRLRPRSPGR